MKKWIAFFRLCIGQRTNEMHFKTWNSCDSTTRLFLRRPMAARKTPAMPNWHQHNHKQDRCAKAENRHRYVQWRKKSPQTAHCTRRLNKCARRQNEFAEQNNEFANKTEADVDSVSPLAVEMNTNTTFALRKQTNTMPKFVSLAVFNVMQRWKWPRRLFHGVCTKFVCARHIGCIFAAYCPTSSGKRILTANIVQTKWHSVHRPRRHLLGCVRFKNAQTASGFGFGQRTTWSSPTTYMFIWPR